MSDISKNIKQLRLSKEMSQTQLAEKLNVTRQTVSSWERGISYPDIPMLEELAKVFGVEVGEVIYLQRKNKPLLPKSEPIPMFFIPLSVFLFFVVVAFTGGDYYWALAFIVGFAAICTRIITEYITTAFSDPTPSKFDEQLKKHTQKQE